MKKKILFMLGVGSCLLMLGACGKSKEIQEDDNSHREKYEETQEDSEKEILEIKEIPEETSEEEGGFRLVEPSDEIVHSFIYQNIVQIYDVVVPQDGSWTVGDVYHAISESTGYEIQFDRNLSEISLIESGIYDGSLEVQFATLYDADFHDICHLTYINPSSELKNFFDCAVIEVTSPRNEYALNFFYAGNLCAVTHEKYLPDYVTEMPEYTERLKQYPVLKYDEIPTYLASQDYPNVREDSKHSYWIECFSDKPVYEVNMEAYFPVKTVRFDVDLTTATCSEIVFSMRYGPATEAVSYIKTLDELTNEQVKKIDDYIRNKYTTVVSGSKKLIGYAYPENASIAGLRMVYETDNSHYFAIDTGACRHFNADIHINPSKLKSDYIYSSLQELSMYELNGSSITEYTIQEE